MFSIIQNVKNREIIGQSSSVAKFVSYLKDEKRTEVPTILKLREFTTKNEEYQQLKVSLPSVCFNFSFKDNYINGKNADAPTGYLYFDIDGTDVFDYDVTHITAFWKSVGGKGFGLLVKVSNLKKEYFKESYKYITDILEIPYDRSCNDISRINIISFDENVYHNEEAAEIDLSGFNEHMDGVAENLPHSESNKKNILGYSLNGGNIKFSNREEILSNLSFEYTPEGYYDFGKEKVKYCKCFTPHKPVYEGIRNSYMSAFAYCFLSINKGINFHLFKHYLSIYNNKYCNPPINSEELRKISEGIYNRRKNIEPINNTELRFIFKDGHTMSHKEKMGIINRILAGEKSLKSFDQLVEILRNWDYQQFPKITQKNLKVVSGKNKKTIEKYYKRARDTANIIANIFQGL
ncbi:BT4734/BF3469 family protein [Elizabethkingia anophelis]|uniref:BT4734/BF3469 family protein n=1 Tax=Elizabethkingia anophelis TaxID=1117645 RepID=UPI00222754E0|nr:BT4734/BF3469 family protein [Elizabethkingia anophelis]MCW2462603.1 hypothetical protein [Elizabethkingia anophelis]MCW2466288.1 hypothetical protein [Elizabethkingia anophelis]MCW2469972.1 hypothetical protein [Elizabethkingia anophelis]HBI9689830.1 hypothetical protein [Elizabethkingia anophelis]HBI9693849.1 hypothetical protein [Elizabethkingia anophelis]